MDDKASTSDMESWFSAAMLWAKATNLDILDVKSQQTLLDAIVEKSPFRRLELGRNDTFESGVEKAKKVFDNMFNLFMRRVGFLKELLELRKNTLELDWEDDIPLSYDEINELISVVATT